MGVEERLGELGIELPPAPVAVGNYLPCLRSGDLVFTSGQIPRGPDGLVTGVVGTDLSAEQGQEAARLCCLAALAAVKAEIGDLDRIRQVVKVNGFVRCAPGFVDQPKVINGASDLLVEVFGDRGRHARAALGANELPLGVAVEIDFVFRVD